MGINVLTVTVYIWLLPATVLAGVIRDIDEEADAAEAVLPCQTYTLSGLLYADCTDRDLDELPGDLNYDTQVLLLSNNEFINFPPQLEYFSRLQSLDLSGNHLRQPLPSYFRNLKHLHYLNLSNNDYTTWTGSGQFNITTLDLSKNKIENIEESAFNGFSKLNILDLYENRIRKLPPKLFSNLSNLDFVDLSKNFFSDFPSLQSSSIRSLELRNCEIVNLYINSMTGMHSLLHLDLSSNQIEDIPDNLASNTLQELNLSYNGLNYLTDLTFSALPHLAVLDLRGNDFRDVWSTSYFSSNPFLREVHAKGNRWSCEGFSIDLLLTYEYLTKEPSKVTDRGSLICYSPNNVTQLSWQQAYIQTWHPRESTTESFTAIAIMIGIIIGILITSFVCRGLMAINKPDDTLRPSTDVTIVNINGNAQQNSRESVVLRIPLNEEDLPPSYDEALLMPRLNASFHSLPDFVNEEDEATRGNNNNYRRSRSIGDLTENRPRTGDRRSIRRPAETRTDS